MWSFSTIKTRISALLQDAAGTIFSTATDGEIELAIKDTEYEIPRWVPYVSSTPNVFQVESRTGTATSDSTSHLVDATNAQFLSTDVGKVVYNSDDKTWAVVTAYTSTSDITLSKDIFPDGNEAYSIYNKGCKEINQINIEDITNRYGIEDGDRIEYPIGTRRNIDDVEGDILTIGVDTSAVDDTSETDADKDVHVYFRKRHFISQLTTLTGVVNLLAGYDAGDTSMILDACQVSVTIRAGQEFTISSTRGTYTVTADASVSGAGAATISFYPGLENDVDNDKVITFKSSTLSSSLEPVFCRYAACKCAMSKSNLPIQQTVSAITVLTTASTAIGNMSARITQAINDVRDGRIETGEAGIIISTDVANQIALMNPEIDKALKDIDEGHIWINEIPKGGPGVPTDFVNYANQDIANARGYLVTAQGYMQQARAGEELSSNYGLLAARELNNASQYANQSVNYLNQIRTSLSVAGAWRHYQEWGEREMAKVENELRGLANPRAYRVYPRT